MKYEIEIAGKKVTLFYGETVKNGTPLIILNTFGEDVQEIWNLVKEKTNKEFILAMVSNIDWNKEMSPWHMEKLYKSENDYTGGADIYIEFLEKEVIPQIKKVVKEKLSQNISKYIIAGYSLAGLFSLYSLYKTNIFDSAICCSGSLWYPNFVDFAKQNDFVKKVEKVYFSLGDREKKTKNELMSKVEEATIEIEKLYKKKGIKTIFELNEGNHFQDVDNRIAKGITWMLESE